MKLNTMAAVMTFISKIENDSASFYEAQADRLPDLKDKLTTWAKENKRFAKQVKQTYFGVITDTLESNYAFQGLDTDDFVLDPTLPDNADPPTVQKRITQMEETIGRFYAEAAGVSDGLMADIPRLFKKIAGKRDERLRVLG